jgi:hypothetical protein
MSIYKMQLLEVVSFDGLTVTVALIREYQSSNVLVEIIAQCKPSFYDSIWHYS